MSRDVPDLEEDVLDERFEAKAAELVENVEHHIEEEQEWFPEVRGGLSRTQFTSQLRERPSADR